jgi:hypothetical protein
MRLQIILIERALRRALPGSNKDAAGLGGGPGAPAGTQHTIASLSVCDCVCVCNCVCAVVCMYLCATPRETILWGLGQRACKKMCTQVALLALASAWIV